METRAPLDTGTEEVREKQRNGFSDFILADIRISFSYVSISGALFARAFRLRFETRIRITRRLKPRDTTRTTAQGGRDNAFSTVFRTSVRY